MLDYLGMDELILNTLKEDMPLGDITTDNLIDGREISKARFISKDDGVIAGLLVSERTFKITDNSVSFKKHVSDGEPVNKGTVIAEIEGPTSALLKGERTALNFLQRLSGVATLTSRYVNKVKDLPVRIVDTRKTTPGLRFLEKYAVRMGGGSNHRFCLSDGVLIKDNHISAAGSIKNAVEIIRARVPHTVKIEVETETIPQVLEALDAKVDIIMLDNMTLDTMKEAVGLINKRAIVEASGNVNLGTVYEIASTGVDIISVGSITHSAPSFDISMRFL
ncbi:MAG TPA: carboxylating nicotinate-nucleotide diphosphorylase [Clostridia bacterium]